jgi:D-alanine-D-alanine ligase
MAHVLILFNQPVLPLHHPEAESESEVLLTVEHVSRSLEEMGHQVSRLGVGRDPEHLVRDIRRTCAEVVFNLFEGVPGESDSESCVASVLEWLGMPFTGSPSSTLSLARNKPLTKFVLRGAGLPTAEFLTIDDPGRSRLQALDGELRSDGTGHVLRWPLIVKPADHDASVGIEQASVVTSPDALQWQAASLFKRFGGRVLIEEFLAGRELTVGVIETRKEIPADFRDRQPGFWRLALPVSEFEFQPSADRWPIVTYDSKWSDTSDEYALTPYREIADIPTALSDRLRRLALQTFTMLGLRDYGRIDFRLDTNDQPFILEVNPNPDISPTAGLAGVLKAVGLSFRDLADDLVWQALARNRPRPA